MSKKAIIVGAGIAGLCTAEQLLKHGWDVTLFEARTPATFRHSTSFAAGGMLAPWSEMESAEPQILQLGRESLQLWPKLLHNCGLDVHFRQNGSLIIAHQRDRPYFQQLSQRITELASPQDYQWLNPTRCEPELEGDFGQALFLPGEAHIDSRQLMDELISYLQKHDRFFLQWDVAIEGLRPFGVKAKGEWETTDLVVDCRGYGAVDSLPQLRAVRGEAYLVDAPSVRLERPIRLLHPRYAVYIVPRDDQRYYIGASSIESDSPAGVSVRSTLELLSAAYSVHKGFAEAHILTSLHGLRPAFPDNSPKIFVQDGLIRLNGLYRHGFLLSPVLAAKLQRYLDQPELAKQDSLFEWC